MVYYTNNPMEWVWENIANLKKQKNLTKKEKSDMKYFYNKTITQFKKKKIEIEKYLREKAKKSNPNVEKELDKMNYLIILNNAINESKKLIELVK